MRSFAFTPLSPSLLALYVPTKSLYAFLGLLFIHDVTHPQANEDDVVPLSEPVRTKSGELVDSITVAKGTPVSISIECMNRCAAIWGEDAKVFRPSRWLEDANGQDGVPAKAKEIQGHRHLLTFGDGPRACLGKNIAVTEFKVRGLGGGFGF